MRATWWCVLVCCSALAAGCSSSSVWLAGLGPAESRRIPAPYSGHEAVVLEDRGIIHHTPSQVERLGPVVSRAPRLAGRVGPRPFLFTRTLRVRLLAPRALQPDRYGQLSVEHVGELRDVEARVIKPDGRVVELGPADVRSEVLAEGYLDAERPLDRLRTTFTFPGLGVGDTVELFYTRRYLFDAGWVFQHPHAAVLASHFALVDPQVPVSLQARLVDPGLVVEPPAKDSISNSLGLGTHEELTTWTARDLAPLPEEPLLPPEGRGVSQIQVLRVE